MKKGGISAIVATVLIILITVAAVTIIWVAIIPMLQDKIDFKTAQVRIVKSEGFTTYDVVKEILTIHVHRGPDKYNITKINLIFLFDGTSESIIVEAPLPNNMRVYGFNLTLLGGKIPNEVHVAPIFNEGYKEVEGMITSKEEISSETIFKIPENLIMLGCRDTEISCVDGLDNDCNGLIDEEDPACGTIPRLIPDPDSIYFWDFETGFNDPLSSLIGTPSGSPLIGPGFSGNGLVLDGTGDYINYGNSPAALFASDLFSVSFWFKKAPSETDGIIMSFSDSNGANIDDLFKGEISNSLLNLTIADGSSRIYIEGSQTINDEWHHVVFAYARFQQNLAIYFDKNLESITANLDIPESGNLDLIFGCEKDTGSSCDLDENAFNGIIDEVVVFEDFLTLSEVTKLYNQEYSIDGGFNWID